MTTEKHNLPDAYFNVQQPDVDTIRVSRHDSERYGLEAIVYFGDDVNMHVRTVAKARELLAAAFETLRILDPDGAVIIRAGNQEIHTVAEILPGPEQTDPWMEEDPPKPAPALVIRPVDLAPNARYEHGETFCDRWDARDGRFRCTAADGHAGDHVHRGIDGKVRHTWPQERPEPAPFTSPDLVMPPADDAAARQKLLLPRCASPGCVLRAGHDGVGEDKDGNEAHAAACTECGAADKPLGDEGQCFDLVRCADRQAAKADAR